jgi:REP element-mobilizing transposase RayT
MDQKGYKIRNQYLPHFVTFTVVGWVDIFTRKECRDILVDSLKYCIMHKGLIIYGYIIMSNHLHLIIEAKEVSLGLSTIIGEFKKFTSKRIIAYLMQSQKESRRNWMLEIFRQHALQTYRNTSFQIWTHDNHPEVIFSHSFMLQKLAYIHNNPVRAGIVRNPSEYLYSSARNYNDMKDVILDVTLFDIGPDVGFIY